MNTTPFIDDWSYGLWPLDASPTPSEQHATFIKLWQSRFDGTDLPKRRDFSFEDFKGLHGWVAIDHIHHNPFDLECVLYGIHLAEMEGREETGMHLSEYQKDPREEKHYFDYLTLQKKAAEQKLISHCKGSLTHKDRPIGAEWIALPCADDGATVSHFISVVRRCTMDELNDIQIPTTK